MSALELHREPRANREERPGNATGGNCWQCDQNAQTEDGRSASKFRSCLISPPPHLILTFQCLQKDAEDTAEQYNYNETDTEFMYYSSKYSYAENEETGQIFIPDIPPSLRNNSFMYLNMSLTADTHFHNISVNTQHSVVQVPTNIYDRSKLFT